jgi:hypothetical protein
MCLNLYKEKSTGKEKPPERAAFSPILEHLIFIAALNHPDCLRLISV